MELVTKPPACQTAWSLAVDRTPGGECKFYTNVHYSCGGEPEGAIGARMTAWLRGSDPILKSSEVLKRLYELKGGKLRIVWVDDVNKRRPTEFDAVNNKHLTLCVLKKVK